MGAVTAEVITDGPDAFTIVSRTRYERSGSCPSCDRELWTQVDEASGQRSGRYLIWCAEPLIMQLHYAWACARPMPLDVIETLPGQIELLPPGVSELPENQPPWTWGNAPGGA